MSEERSDRGPTRRQYLRRVGGPIALSTVAGCLGDAASRTAEGGESVSTDAAPNTDVGPVGPYDPSITHDVTTWSAYDPEWTPPTAPPPDDYEVEVLAENLEIPWDLSFAPSGKLFLTERVGRVRAYDDGELRTVAEPADLIAAGSVAPGSDDRPWMVDGGEGGLLGVAVHPTYPDPPLVYAYYTAETADGSRNRIVAFDGRAEGGDDGPWRIVDGIPAHTFHNGGRLAFGPANYLWVTTGDADPGIESPERTRDPASLAGSVLRVTPAGDPPSGGDRRGDARIHTHGHRNPQGLAWLPDGTGLVAEHGPGGGDEVSVLRAGGDYGWPAIRAGDAFGSYPGTGYVPPVVSAPDWAPSGAVFYTGDELPGLRNRLLVAGLLSQRIVAITLSRDRPADGHDDRYAADWLDETYHAASTPLFDGAFGRVRTLEQGPDGGLYAITSNRDGRSDGDFPTARDDRLLRIRPA
jgi:glucose/arabinose dehydrogenase